MTKILLVEDQDDIRTILAVTLSHQGYQVDAYTDGESALQAIGSSWPEIAILDSSLPGVSGLEVGRVIDEITGNRKRVCKVLFTGNNSPKLEEQLQTNGFDLFVSKPVSISDFCGKLDQLILKSPP